MANPQGPAAGGDGVARMKAIQARILGQSAPQATPATEAATPRTLPSPQLTAPTTTPMNSHASPSLVQTSSRANQATQPPQQAVATTGAASTAATGSAGEDARMADAPTGPSLHGNADSLAVARQLQQDHSANARASRTSRTRRAAGRGSGAPAPTMSSSPRVPLASLGSNSTLPPIHESQRIGSATGSSGSERTVHTSSADGVRIQASSTQPAAAPKVDGWNAFAAAPAVAATRNSVESSTNPPKRQANDEPSPPHRRTKAAATSASVENSVPASNDANSTNIADSAVAEIQPTSTTAIQAAGVASAGTQTTSDGVFTTAEGIAIKAKLDEHDRRLDEHDRRLDTLEKRADWYGRDHLDLQKKLVAMVKAEECRKFLGTESAKVPFVISVKMDGSTVNVQVHAKLKVSELITRVRVEADLTVYQVVNPIICVDGEDVGHQMTLGEVGIGKDGSAKVAFRYEEGSFI